MTLVFTCIAPHGSEIIPQLAGDKLKAFGKTRQGMLKMAQIMKEQKVNTIIIATPHNLRLRENIGIIMTEFTEGSLETEEGSVKIRFQCNRPLAEDIYTKARKRGLPVVAVNYGTSEGPTSCMPMDWGTLIPLWFFGTTTAKTQVVVVTPSREIPLKELVEFGGVIAQTAEKSAARIAFVASADQAHAHDPKGPYGFSSAAANFDRLVVEAVEENELDALLSLEQKLVEDAKPDSIWQMAVLIGVLEEVPMKAKLISYQAPTYYGMLCATYTPKK